MRAVVSRGYGFFLCERQVTGSNLKIAGQNISALDQVAELAQVSWKTVLPQLLQGRFAQTAAGHLQLSGDLLAEDVAHSWNVFDAIAQGRQVNGDHGKPVEKVLAKQAFFHPLLKITMRRHQHANIDLARTGRSHAQQLSIG